MSHLVPDLDAAADVALAAAREAAAMIMRVYAAPFEVQFKAKDDPVTIADRESNAFLCERLAAAFPGVPIVAEESDPHSYVGFEKAEAVWFVDPLDGTREFVARNGEFAVMVGLARHGRAQMGVILAPAWGRAFVGVVGRGAWEIAADGTRTPIRVSTQDSMGGATILVSRSRTPPQLAALVATLGAHRAVIHGSSGLKAVLVAIGQNDVFFQRAPAGMRWDACASEALVIAAGGACTDLDGAPFDYANPDILNSRGLVASNGHLQQAMLTALNARR